MPNYFLIHNDKKRINFQNTTFKKKKLRILRTGLNSRKAGLPYNHPSATKFVRPNARTRGSATPTSPSPLRMHVCGRIPSARVHNARGPWWKIYIRGTKGRNVFTQLSPHRRAELSPSPAPIPHHRPLESLSALERTTVPTVLPSLSLPSLLRSPWSTAHLHGMHSYEIDHSSNDFSSRLCIPVYRACIMLVF